MKSFDSVANSDEQFNLTIDGATVLKAIRDRGVKGLLQSDNSQLRSDFQDQENRQN